MIAIRAFPSKNMEGNFWFLLTIITDDFHLHVFILIWHWSSTNFFVNRLSNSFHNFLWVNWSFTQWTWKVVSCNCWITRCMNPMTTLELGRTLSRNGCWLKTERTVSSLNTFMLLSHWVSQALLTSLAMPKVFSTSYSTNPASFTMKDLLPFNLIVIEMADMADVVCKFLITWNAFIFTNRLFRLTSQALDVLNFKSVQIMMLLNVL